MLAPNVMTAIVSPVQKTVSKIRNFHSVPLTKGLKFITNDKIEKPNEIEVSNTL